MICVSGLSVVSTICNERRHIRGHPQTFTHSLVTCRLTICRLITTAAFFALEADRQEKVNLLRTTKQHAIRDNRPRHPDKARIAAEPPFNNQNKNTEFSLFSCSLSSPPPPRVGGVLKLTFTRDNIGGESIFTFPAFKNKSQCLFSLALLCFWFWSTQVNSPSPPPPASLLATLFL